MIANSDAAIFGRILEAGTPMLSPDAARFILALDFRYEDRRHMDALAAKGRNGELTADENEELENYVRVGDLLAVMQSKARRSARDSGKRS